MSLHNKTLGRLGEDAAAKYLVNNKYKILCQNYSCRFGELDIIAQYKKDIVIIEVKTRQTNEYGSPSQAINHFKKQNIINCAKNYVFENNIENNINFDVIEVIANFDGINFAVNEINHIKNAFLDVY